MSGLLAIRDTIKDFLRKYDEITTPISRFLVALIMFWSINSLYGYSELFSKGIVIFLLSVICALVSNPVMVMLGGIVIAINTFSVSIEVGILFSLLFMIMYLMYMRMFQNCCWILALVPFLYMIKMYYAIPIVVAIFAGASGIVPTAFGVLLYYFAVYTKDVKGILDSASENKDFQAYSYIVEAIFKNKEMLLAIIVFAVVIMITYLIYSLPFDYSWYIAIGIGGICNILFFLVCSIMVDVSVSIGPLLIGSIIGTIVALIIQICKSIVDYSRKESVQFEDDEYYYYVKAIPKYNVATKNKNVKRMTQSKVSENVKRSNPQRKEAIRSNSLET